VCQKKRRPAIGRRFFYNSYSLEPTAYIALQSTNLRQSRLDLAGRGTAAESIQAILPPAFHAVDEFFVAFLDTVLTFFTIIFFSHGVILHIFALPVKRLSRYPEK
jgi:hypothetical protein